MPRRLCSLFALLALAAAPALAQQTIEFGKSVVLRANTPEQKGLDEISALTDPALKLAAIEKFIADFASSDSVILGYELLLAHYQSAANHDQVFAVADKMLAVDPDNLPSVFIAFRSAQQKPDVEKQFAYAAAMEPILARFRARPAPEGADPADWDARKKATLASVQDELNFVEYTLFVSSSQQQNPAPRAALLERFLIAYPSSIYAPNAQSLIAATYQQTQQYPKMLEFAQGVLSRDPNNLPMLLLLADYWSETGQQLDPAEAHAQKAISLLSSANRPENVPEDQWTQQLNLQRGIALSALGQVQIRKNRLPAALESFRAASPLLKSDLINYGRNLYRLGFTLGRLNRIPEARTVLTEAASLDTPYRNLARETLDTIGGAPAKRPGKKRP